MTQKLIRKIFYNYYKDYIEKIEKHDLDYSFHEDLSIDESDYIVYNTDAYLYALTRTSDYLYLNQDRSNE